MEFILDTADHLKVLDVALSKGDMDLANKTLAGICKTPLGMSQNLEKIYAAYVTRGLANEVVTEFMRSDSVIWKRLSLLCRLARLVEDENALKIYEMRIKEVTASSDSFSFSENEFLIHRELSVSKLLFDLKYVGHVFTDPDPTGFADSEKISERITFNEFALKFLFARRSDKSRAWADWRRDVKKARAIEHLIRDQDICSGERTRIIEKNFKNRELLEKKSDRGTLVLFHHGGFASVRVVHFPNVFPDAVYLTNHQLWENRIAIGDDGAPSLMQALRVLLKSGLVAISPDGIRGGDGEIISILGQPFAIRDGAALLAFESRCRTIFYAMAFNGERFIPIVREGPERKKTDTFETFKCKMALFYQKCLNEYFTSDPIGLVYASSWTKFFSDAQKRLVVNTTSFANKSKHKIAINQTK